MPATMGRGFRNRAASSSASNCLLSPISPRATANVATRKASIRTDRRAALPEVEFERDFAQSFSFGAETTLDKASEIVARDEHAGRAARSVSGRHNKGRGE